MRATLVRFGPKLFEELKAEAEQSGVSIAQYVREAVVARIAYNAGRRGEPGYEPGRKSPAVVETARIREEAAAVRAQSQQAAAQARRVRQQSKRG